MDRAMLRVLTQAEGGRLGQGEACEKGFCEDIKKYFSSSIRDAEQLLSLDPEEPPKRGKKTGKNKEDDAAEEPKKKRAKKDADDAMSSDSASGI